MMHDYNQDTSHHELDDRRGKQSGEGDGLSGTLDRLLDEARPRLLRFASSYGVDPDTADDVVQETLVEAWLHLARFRVTESFDAWLLGICRNMCLRWRRQQRTTSSHLKSIQQNNDDIDGLNGTWAYRAYKMGNAIEPLALDPLEELCRQDVSTLVDRAMSYLPESARQALDTYYLQDVPINEAALRLGISRNALEVRIHRARHQLRQVLRSTLRTDAEAFGLALDKEMAAGWRESREWCFLCGRHHLIGIFEVQDNGNIDLRMRCPTCSRHNGNDIVMFGGLVDFGSLRSFRPAMKRGNQAIATLCSEVITTGKLTCPYCNSQASFRGIEQLDFGFPYQQRYCLPLDCPLCGSYILSGLMSALMMHPDIQAFAATHPRWISEPEDVVEYAEQPVIRVRLADSVSSSRLALLVHPHTLEVLHSVKE